jgi:hypothetical protein
MTPEQLASEFRRRDIARLSIDARRRLEDVAIAAPADAPINTCFPELLEPSPQELNSWLQLEIPHGHQSRVDDRASAGWLHGGLRPVRAVSRGVRQVLGLVLAGFAFVIGILSAAVMTAAVSLIVVYAVLCRVARWVKGDDANNV